VKLTKAQITAIGVLLIGLVVALGKLISDDGIAAGLLAALFLLALAAMSLVALLAFYLSQPPDDRRGDSRKTSRKKPRRR
jgi:hypothetical protein